MRWNESEDIRRYYCKSPLPFLEGHGNLRRKQMKKNSQMHLSTTGEGKYLGKNTDQIAIPGYIIELIHEENLSTLMKDKKIRESQHRFTYIKLCRASLTAIYDEMASLVNGEE